MRQRLKAFSKSGSFGRLGARSHTNVATVAKGTCTKMKRFVTSSPVAVISMFEVSEALRYYDKTL